MTDFASLGIEIDSRPVVEGTKALDAFGEASVRVEQKVRVSNGQMADTSKLLAAQAQAAKDAAGASGTLNNATTQLTLGQQIFIEKLREQAATIGMSRSQLLAFQAAELGVTDQTKLLIAQINEASKAQSGHSAGMSSSLAKIEALRVAHDAMIGSYTRMGSSLFVLGNATGVSTALFSASMAPLLAVGVAVAAVTYEVIKGALEWKHLDEAIARTGYSIGLTNTQISDMAGFVGASTGHLTMAHEALNLFVASGRVGSSVLRDFGRAAVEMAQDSGMKLADATKELVKMQQDALKWAEDFQQAHHLLNGEQAETIIKLDAQGKQAEAVKAILKAMHEEHTVMAAKQKEEMGFILRYYDDWSKGIDRIKAGLMSMGAPTSSFDKAAGKLIEIDQLKQNLDLAEQRRDTAAVARYKVLIDQDYAQIAALTALEKARNGAAQSSADSKRAGDAAFGLSRYLDAGYQSDDQRRADLVKAENKTFAEVTAAYQKGSVEYEKAVRHHNQNLIDIDGQYRAVAKASQADNITLQDTIKRLQVAAVAERQHYEDLSRLDEMYHKAGDLTDQQFYDRKRATADRIAAAAISGYDQEINALVAHDNASVDEEARTQKQIDGIYDKRKAAKARDIAESFRLDEEERLRTRQNIVNATADAYQETNALYKQTDAVNLKIAAFGLLPQTVNAAEIAELNYKLRLMELSDWEGIQTAALKARIAALKDLGDRQKVLADQDREAQQFKSVWESIDRTAEATFTNIFEGGKSAFDRLRDTLKSGLLDMLYQMTLKKWIFNITAVATGASAGAVGTVANASGINQASSLVSAATGAYNLFQAGSAVGGGSIYGVASGATYGTNFMSQQSLMLAAQEASGASSSALSGAASLYGNSAAVGAGGYGAAGAGLVAGETGAMDMGIVAASATEGGLMTSATAALGAIGPVGWAVIAAIAVAAYISHNASEEHTTLTFGSSAKGVTGSKSTLTDQHDGNYVGGAGVNTAFGSVGISSQHWMDAIADVNKPKLDAFLGSIKKTDDAMAAFLTTAERATVTAALDNRQVTVGTGPEGSDPSKMYGAVYVDRLTAIMNAVDPGLAGLTAGFQGTVDQLATESLALLQYRKALSETGQAVFGAKVTLQDLAALKGDTESTAMAVARLISVFQLTNAVADSLGKSSADTFGAVGLASDAARERLVNLAGGMDKLQAGAAFFAQNMLSEGDRLAPVIERVRQNMKDLGLEGVTTNAQFVEVVRGHLDANKQLVGGIDLSTEAGAQLYTKMMTLAPEFKQVADAAGSAGEAMRSAADIANERKGLQNQLNQATLSQVELLALQRAAIDTSNQALFDQVQAAVASKAATDALAASNKAAADALAAANKAAADSLASINDGYQKQIDALVKAALPLAEQRALEVRGMDASTLALYTRLESLNAEKDAAKAAADAKVAADARTAEAAKALATTNAGFQQQIDSLVKASIPLAQQRALEVAGMDASTLALYTRLEALKTEAKASADAKAAADALASVNAGYQSQIDALVKTGLPLAQQRALETQGMDASTLALYTRLEALNAEKAATDAIAKASDTAAAALQQYAAAAMSAARSDVSSARTAADAAYKRAIDAVNAGETTRITDVADKRKALIDAYNRESATLTTTRDRFDSFAKSIRALRDSLATGNLSTLSPEQKYFELKRQFESTTALSKAGDPAAQQRFQTSLQDFLTASKDYNGSGQGFVADYQSAQEAIGAVASSADAQVSLAQQQLDALATQVRGLTTVDTSVQSVEQAVTAFRTAQASLDAFNATEQRRLLTEQASSLVSVDTGIQTLTEALNSLSRALANQLTLAQNPTAAANAGFVNSLYQGIGRTADTGGAAYWTGQLSSGQTQAQVASSFSASAQRVSAEDYVRSLYATVDGAVRTPDSAGLDYWTNQLLSGTGPDALKAQFKNAVDQVNGIHGSHADGLDFVPFDGYRAKLHMGEKVQTASQVKQDAATNREVVALLRTVVDELRADKVQRGAVGMAALDKLDKVADGLAGNKRELARA